MEHFGKEPGLTERAVMPVRLGLRIFVVQLWSKIGV